MPKPLTPTSKPLNSTPARSSLARLAAAAALALAAAGCGSSASHSSSARPAGSAPSPAPATATAQASSRPGATIRDVIDNMKFNPGTLHAKVGQKIEWVNADGPPHNITYASGPRFPDSPRIIYPGHSYTIMLTKPGTISYFCSIHPFMRGTIVVSR